jgi:UDP-glucose 4-epimerase
LAHYLVTGGCGFIGSHLVDALIAAGHRIRILDDLSSGKRANVPAAAEVVVGDVADPAIVRGAMNGVDGCFHLAAIASVARANADWLGTHRVNLTGAITVLDAARARRTPVVYASSAAVYGDNPNVPLSEDAVTRPLSAYGADKLGCELHARVAWHVHRVPNTGVRLFNIYGPRQDPNSPYSGVISIFADRVRRGAPIEIHGDGGQTRDFVYVADAVAHLIAAMGKAGEAAIYNACTGRATSVGALADAIEAAAGKRVERRTIAARTGDIRASIGNPARARASLGVAAQMPLADGLKATLASLN